MVLQRPTSPARIHPLLGDGGPFFNCGRVAFATWNGSYVTTDPELFGTDAKNEGKIGLSMFSSRFLRSKGLKALAKCKTLGNHTSEQANGSRNRYAGKAFSNEVVTYFSDEETDGDVEWTHGNFSLENYTLALKRSEKDLSYNHSLGMQFTKVKFILCRAFTKGNFKIYLLYNIKCASVSQITGDIFVGSCLQSVADVTTLAKDLVS